MLNALNAHEFLGNFKHSYALRNGMLKHKAEGVGAQNPCAALKCCGLSFIYRFMGLAAGSARKAAG